MELLKIDSVYKKDDKGFELKAISFVQNKLQKIAVAGETGSGKTTLMKIAAGLINPDQGNIYFQNERLKRVPEEKLIPGHKGIAYLSQHFDLPHFLRVEQALEYATELDAKEAAKLFSICHIDHLLKRRTDQLSGGERQRIALARVLVSKPGLLLLDEPFSNSDPGHKLVLKSILKNLGEELGLTCMLISHDPSDSLPWADTIIVMRDGQIIQQGGPMEIYHYPLNEYVADLFGRSNLVTDSIKKELSKLEGYDQLIDRKFLRPGVFKVSFNNNIGVAAKVIEVSFLGAYYEVEVLLNRQSLFVTTDDASIKPGAEIFLSIR